MTVQAGDLICHNLHSDKLVGIVIKKDKKHDHYYKVFWYTTGKTQSIHIKFIDIYRR